ncbi:hypothetical protein PR202_gb29855 [Eleusine coracana subsp. coracana]|uniref:Protein argonaute 7 n=1 Tax=Eleusine coracana subsp. coracana TaxID=191504 RepID=A0AAV5G0G5_ELECO|nr:hypothetical protein PR202_gb29855 [Eleusine coracana subsp. coracana]
MELEGNNGMANKDRKVAGSGGGAARNGSGADGRRRRRRWTRDGGGGGGRQHPIIQAYPALLPLPIHAAAHTRANGSCGLPLPPPVLVYLQPPPLLFPKAAAMAACYGKPNGGAPPQRGGTWRSKKPPPPPHAVTAALLPLPHGSEMLQNKRCFTDETIPCVMKPNNASTHQNSSVSIQGATIALRPDVGGVNGTMIPLYANHFLVRFDPNQKIFHYNVDISPRPSKETARLIKNKLVEENSSALLGALLAFDGRKNLFSPIGFQQGKLEFFVSLPVASPRFVAAGRNDQQKHKIFRVNLRLVSELSGDDLVKYFNEEKGGIPLPQDYLHALDIILQEGSMESSIPVGRSLYSRSMGDARKIGGGAVGLSGFFQRLRPTKQGLALNVDLSITAFHESTGIIAYLQKRCEFLKGLSQMKSRALTEDERREVEKALKNIRVFVCHRQTDQRYDVRGLTEETTENLKFRDRSGKEYMVVDYFKEHYNHDIQFRNLPCLQIGRSKPCYVPMELCMVCEGQKFLGKLSDEQTSKMLNMGCHGPSERKGIIKGVVEGAFTAKGCSYVDQFNLHVSKDMTQLSGRVLLPPKLKLGDRGRIKDITPDRFDRQWSLLDSHVAEGSNIKSWALISFGGTTEQHSFIPKFISQLSSRCEQLGILLNKRTVVSPLFERIELLNNRDILERNLKKLQEAASGNLQLLICVMERKHRGYADLKRIAETSVGVVTVLPVLQLKQTDFSVPGQFSTEDKCKAWMRSQTHRKEIIEHLDVMTSELLEEFLKEVGKLPSRIIFFRDGVCETLFGKVLKEELQAMRATCSNYPGYKPSITFIVVQKRHHTRLFHREKNGGSTHYSDQNVPPGTVVDTVITHPREFDFYLCSHWGTKGTSRPTHYHVLWDENKFQSDEMQQLIYNLCYTFARCTKPVSLVPPVYYAHLAAYRGRLYLERSDSVVTSRTTLYRAAPLQTAPLPKLRDSVKRLMFYC